MGNRGREGWRFRSVGGGRESDARSAGGVDARTDARRSNDARRAVDANEKRDEARSSAHLLRTSRPRVLGDRADADRKLAPLSRRIVERAPRDFSAIRARDRRERDVERERRA